MLEQLQLTGDGFDYLSYAEVKTHAEAWNEHRLQLLASNKIAWHTAWRETEGRKTVYKIVFQSGVNTKRVAKRVAIAYVSFQFPFYDKMQVEQFGYEDNTFKGIRTIVTIEMSL